MTFPKDLAPGFYNTISMLERVSASVSVIGCILIFLIALTMSEVSKKPGTRIIWMAAIGNLCCSVASMISEAPHTTGNKALCLTQATLIQIFMSADVYWAFCFAVNSCRMILGGLPNHEHLAASDKWYALFCYGVPSIIGLTYVGLSAYGVEIYSDATIWCWISPKYESLRLLTFYLIVWILIAGSGVCYILIFRKIVKSHMATEASKSGLAAHVIPNDSFASLISNRVPSPPAAFSRRFAYHDDPRDGNMMAPSSSSPRTPSQPIPGPSSSHNLTRPSPIFLSPPSHQNGFHFGSFQPMPPSPTLQSNERKRRMKFGMRAPAMANAFTTTIKSNKAAKAYAYFTLMYYLQTLIIWIPPTANRVYTMINHGQVSIPWSYAAAFVLPLQGFANFLLFLYIVRRPLAKRLELGTPWRMAMDRMIATMVFGITASYDFMKRTLASWCHGLNLADTAMIIFCARMVSICSYGLRKGIMTILKVAQDLYFMIGELFSLLKSIMILLHLKIAATFWYRAICRWFVNRRAERGQDYFEDVEMETRGTSVHSASSIGIAL